MSPPPSPTEEIDASLSSPSSSRRPAIAFTSPRAKPPPKVARKLDFNDDADESEDEAMRYSSPLKRKTAPPRMPPVDLEPAPRAPPRVFHGPQLPSPPAKRTYAPTGRDAALDGLRAYNPTAHHQHAPRLDDRRAPRPPVQRYTVAQPAPLSPPADAGVTIDEVPANWANVPAGPLRDVAMRASLPVITEATRRTYEKHRRTKWEPWVQWVQFSGNILDMTPELVLHWLEYMLAPNTCGRPTIVQYLLAMSWYWNEANARQIIRGLPAKDREENPFRSKPVLNAKKGLTHRIRQVKENMKLKRGAIVPETMFLFKLALDELAVMAQQRLATPETALAFEFVHLERYRNMLCVLVAYTFGLRASTLHQMTAKSLVVDGRGNLGYVPSGDKTHATCRGEMGQTRTMRQSNWNERLQWHLRFYCALRLTYYSIRTAPGSLAISPQTSLQESEMRSHWRTPGGFEESKKRVTEEMMPDLLWMLPLEHEVKVDNCATVITARLQKSMKAVKATPASEGEKFTSHSIRAGAASAFIACNPGARDLAQWWFQWALSSDTASEYYIRYNWSERSHPKSMYFFGHMAVRDFVDADEDVVEYFGQQ